MSNLPTIVRKEIDNSHYYWVNDEFYPSVTRILDEAGPKEFGLVNWFKNNSADDIEIKSQEAKNKGSRVHDACEKLLNGLEIPLKDYPEEDKRLIARFYDWYGMFQPKNYQTEHAVASVTHKYAGTLDLVCELNGKKVIVDLKTNKNGIYFTNKVQLMAYKAAYEEMHGEKIAGCYVLRLGAKNKLGFEFKLIDDVAVDDFLQIYKTYLTMNGGVIPEPPVINVYPDSLKLSVISLKN